MFLVLFRQDLALQPKTPPQQRLCRSEAPLQRTQHLRSPWRWAKAFRPTQTSHVRSFSWGFLEMFWWFFFKGGSRVLEISNPFGGAGHTFFRCFIFPKGDDSKRETWGTLQNKGLLFWSSGPPYYDKQSPALLGRQKHLTTPCLMVLKNMFGWKHQGAARNNSGETFNYFHCAGML